MEKSKTWLLQVGAWCLDLRTNHSTSEKHCLFANNRGKMSKEGNPPGKGMVCLQRSLAWRVLRGLWLVMSWVARQPSEEEILRDGLLWSEITIATRHVNQTSP